MHSPTPQSPAQHDAASARSGASAAEASSDGSIGASQSRSDASSPPPCRAGGPPSPPAYEAVPCVGDAPTVESRGWAAFAALLCAAGAAHSIAALIACAVLAFVLRPYPLLAAPRRTAPESARAGAAARAAKWAAATADCPRTGRQYLVVGASGFLGRRVVDLLLHRGEARVRCFDLFPCAARPEWAADPRIELVRGDVTNAADLRKACAGVDCVYSTFARMSFHERLAHQAAASERVNVRGTEVLLAACREAGVRDIVYTSTSHVMKPGEMIDESAPLVDRATSHSHYGWTKAAAEQMALAASSDATRVVALRPCSAVFGGEDARLAQRIIGRGLNGMPGVRMGALLHPCSRSDFVYVDNVVLGLMKGEARLLDGSAGVAGEAFNISNEEPMTYHEFVRTLQRWQPGVCIVVLPPAVVTLLSRVSEAAQRVGAAIGRRVSLGQDIDQLTVATVTGVRQHLTVRGDKARQRLNYWAVYSVDDGALASVEEVARQEGSR